MWWGPFLGMESGVFQILSFGPPVLECLGMFRKCLFPGLPLPLIHNLWKRDLGICTLSNPGSQAPDFLLSDVPIFSFENFTYVSAKLNLLSLGLFIRNKGGDLFQLTEFCINLEVSKCSLAPAWYKQWLKAVYLKLFSSCLFTQRTVSIKWRVVIECFQSHSFILGRSGKETFGENFKAIYVGFHRASLQSQEESPGLRFISYKDCK